MKFSHKNYTGKPSEASMLVVLATEGRVPDLPAGVTIPKHTTKGFKGEFRESRLTDATAGKAERVMYIGLGKSGEVDGEKVRRAAAIAVQKAEHVSAKTLAILVDDEVASTAGGPESFGAALAEGAVMGAYRYDLGKSKPEPRKLEQAHSLAVGAAFKHGVEYGIALGEANVFARDLQNRAGNQATPRFLAAEAQKLARRSSRITCKVLDEAGMKKLGMGLLLGVAQGSREPARLIHLTYKPGGAARKKVALVGKGLTFDAGGISLKPAAKMEEMRYDMSGGAAVLGAFHALASLDVPCEVHGIIPSTENLPGGEATKPGDVHVAMNGTTVEVINTDAEGRLILADALCYTLAKVKPKTIVDLATLTGAVVVALGHEMTGMFATTDRLAGQLTAAGDATGEKVWRLPLLPGHVENLKGGPADLRNICTPDLMGGSIAGAAFLSQFVGDTEWSHLDIAGTAWGQSSRDYVGGNGGTGVGVRLLMSFLAEGA